MDNNHNDVPLRRGRHKIRKKNKKLDRILNYLIAIVSVLIIISAIIILTDSDEKDVKQEQLVDSKKQTESSGVEEKSIERQDFTTKLEEQVQETRVPTSSEKESLAEAIKETTSSDPIVEKVLVNPNWQPTPTVQSGAHLSSYDEKSPDWKEKMVTFFSATGLSEDQSIVWSVKNNGGPQTAIGVISSKDKQQKYRVFIEWVDNKGWKPVKIEVLNTLEGAY